MGEALRQGGGRISVEEFMRLALHDPEHGYYSRNVRTVGRGGDFSTTATIHGALGKAIAQWRKQHNLIEIGAGDGSLAESVLNAAGWWGRRRLRYHIVDSSQPLVEQQREKLARFGSRVKWHEDMGAALGACGGQADVFSNELVDAFPAVSLRWNAGREAWDEVFVTAEGVEVFERCEEEPDWGSLSLRDGQRCEWHRSYRDWLAGWLPGLKHGRLLTIDYGGNDLHEIYERRLNGSLRAYFAQMRLDGVEEFYQRVGRQDLTADVHFTDVLRWGEALGLEASSLSDQREFLIKQLPGIEKKAKRDAALDFLLDEHGAGGAFKVLEQHQL